MLQDPATLRNDDWYKGKTNTSMTTMKMDYGDEMMLNVQDSIGVSLVILRCDVMSTWLTLIWITIYRRMIILPSDTCSLYTDESTTTECTLPPFARNEP
jgi:hypothetical protein